MLEHSEVDATIHYDKARWVLSRYMIPKDLRMNIIDEMIEFGLLERMNQKCLKIKESTR